MGKLNEQLDHPISGMSTSFDSDDASKTSQDTFDVLARSSKTVGTK